MLAGGDPVGGRVDMNHVVCTMKVFVEVRAVVRVIRLCAWFSAQRSRPRPRRAPAWTGSLCADAHQASSVLAERFCKHPPSLQSSKAARRKSTERIHTQSEKDR